MAKQIVYLVLFVVLVSMMPKSQANSLCDSYVRIEQNDLFLDYSRGKMKVFLPRKQVEYFVTSYSSKLRGLHSEPYREIEVWDARTGTVLCYRQKLTAALNKTYRF